MKRRYWRVGAFAALVAVSGCQPDGTIGLPSTTTRPAATTAGGTQPTTTHDHDHDHTTSTSTTTSTASSSSSSSTRAPAAPTTPSTTRPTTSTAPPTTGSPPPAGVLPHPPLDGPIAPFAAAPACPTHDPRAFHGLWDAKRGCHYDHEHHDNPREVDSVFGTSWFAKTGGEVSYPWQTFHQHSGGTTLENDAKHNGYKWLVRKGMPCVSAHSDGCVTDFRAQIHAVAGAMDAVARYHSFTFEARGCLKANPDRCGIIRTGGWIDTGPLLVDDKRVVLPTDPPDLRDIGNRRMHGSPASGGGQRVFMTWYMHNVAWSGLAIMTPRTFGPIDPANPSQQLFHCDLTNPKCKQNGSTLQAHVLEFVVPARLDPDGDGRVTYRGYSDRYGNLVEGCTAVGLDCVPYELIDMPVGHFQYRDDAHGIGDDGRYDYDVSPPGVAWIKFPN